MNDNLRNVYHEGYAILFDNLLDSLCVSLKACIGI